MAAKAGALSRAFAIMASCRTHPHVRDAVSGPQARRLYTHMNDRLVDANCQRSSVPIREVITLLTPLRDAWSQVASPAASISA